MPPVLVLPFPAIDPVLVSFRPVCRSLVRARLCCREFCSGWLYARVLIRSPRLWAASAPLTVVDFDDFILWVTLGHYPRRPHRLCPVLQSAALRRNIQATSSRCGKAACRFTAASSAACWPSCCLHGSAASTFSRSAISPARQLPIGICLGRIANFINGELWGRTD